MKVKMKITPVQLLTLIDLGLFDIYKQSIEMNGKTAKRISKHLRDKK